MTGRCESSDDGAWRDLDETVADGPGPAQVPANLVSSAFSVVMWDLKSSGKTNTRRVEPLSICVAKTLSCI